ncbi:MAG TPA: DUF1015 family protein [Alphaproteobacteria bacterium]|nr:DUF1015 family protein [Alphaproteobacteria bacterium]
MAAKIKRPRAVTPQPTASSRTTPASGDAPLLAPFRGLRPTQAAAAGIIAPPYDVMTTDEARQFADGREYCFFKVSRPEITMAPGSDPHGTDAYAAAGSALRRMVEAGVLIRDQTPAYYVYRIADGEHVQTGLAAAAPVAAYETGFIRRHEFTRPDRELDRAHQIDAVNAQTGPVLAIHRRDPAFEALLDAATAAAPDCDVSVDGVRHTVWVVADPETVAAIAAAAEALDALYIADGHHRSAAAARVAAMRREANPGHRGDEAYNGFLVITFPDDQVRVLDYNRVVYDLNGLTVETFLAQVAGAFTVTPSEGPARPAGVYEFGLYVGGRWYRLNLLEPPAADADVLVRLDVSLLADRLLGPILGIGDPREDMRVDFVGGARGLEWLEHLVDDGPMAAAFALYPTQVATLLEVADAGAIMPPKSTWFEPKLADGLISYPLD